MSIRKVDLAINEYFHVYNRGNDKRKIFHDKQDYERFVKLLLILNNNESLKSRDIKNLIAYGKSKNPLVSIGAWVLMPNHFHILFKSKIEGGISRFMQKLSTAYAMYYNQKYDRTGSLFEGKFKAEHLDTDRYLKYIFSYIHLNPVKLIQKDWKEKGIKNKKEVLIFLDNYIYSSYFDYIENKRIQNQILNKEDFPKYFSTIHNFQNEIMYWISFRNY